MVFIYVIKSAMQTHTPSSFALLTSFLLSAAACGDDSGPGGAGGTGSTTGNTTGATSTKSASVTATGTASVTSTTATATANSSSSTGVAPFVPPTPFAVPLSPGGQDQLQSVTAAAPGEFLAAGYAAGTLDGPRAVVVVKFTPMGPVGTFGTGGVAITSLVFAGGSDEIDIATQSDGKIIVSATVANATVPADRDVAVMRLNADGTLDATFGVAGVRILDLNSAHDNAGMLVGLDASRGLTVNASDEIFVHAASRGLGNATGGGPRVDTDFTVVKLSANGAQDMTFGSAGQARLDIQEANATVRGIKALADGSLIAGGYANTPDLGSTQAVLYKLTPTGQLDAGFATGGVFHDAVLAVQTEVYNFAIHGNNIVTAGYGRNTGDTNDYVSLRFDATTGERDGDWGGAQNGAVLIDPSGAMLGSNARSAFGLPDGSTVIVGSTGPGNMPAQDAVFVVLDADGALNTDYLTGIHLFKLGADGNDQFWGGAVSGDYAAIVGYKGGGAMQTAASNDDSFGIVFALQ